ncbi:hypothetical protein [Sphingorhabdus sp.]|jgi:hypothetical protein|uniref:hypothetical protein n=1 Tax=Sphingorhabdus sp. TaxID=1902408 RepID=UPI003BAF6466|nr:hypothetical protein [Sphingomonadales bacterium]MBK9431039.1 hypothetical protein [Sphingomonadales bacterium]MBL0021180.1 hypothetical protein [Sphingomonadales bacterium]
MARNYRYVVEALSAKHARLQGLVARDSQRQPDLEAVERVIRMYDASWTPPAPIRPRRPAIMDRFGALTTGALEVLREADRPLKTREIARMVLAKRGIHDAASIGAADTSIVAGLKARVGKGVMRHDGKPVRWTIKAP